MSVFQRQEKPLQLNPKL